MAEINTEKPATIQDAKLEKYVAKRTANALAKLGIETVADLIFHVPFRLGKRGELLPIEQVSVGQAVTVIARVIHTDLRPMHARRGFILNVQITDGAHELQLTFFAKSPRSLQYHAAKLSPGTLATFSGTINEYRNQLQLQHPEYEVFTAEKEIDRSAIAAPIPIYHASAKLPSWQLARAVQTVLPLVTEAAFPEILPPDYLATHGLPARAPALRSLHQPQSAAEWEKAHLRMVHEEAFVLQTLLARRAVQAATFGAPPAPIPPASNPAAPLSAASAISRPSAAATPTLLARFDQMLPFQLTAGQRAVGKQIAADLAQNVPMRRLLQGDVGTGKTVVALRAMLQVIDAGYQAVLLAPTEVLAEQHYASISALLGQLAAQQAPTQSIAQVTKEAAEQLVAPESVRQCATKQGAQMQLWETEKRTCQINAQINAQNNAQSTSQHSAIEKPTQLAELHEAHESAPLSVSAPSPLATSSPLSAPSPAANPPQVRLQLLIGALSAKEKQVAYSQIATQQAQLIIGTHALLEDKVQFPALGLVVVDEQHRFGVDQRDKLAQGAHLLVMTATPIPRTLAMTFFGDLTVSTLQELPQGRKPITTTLVPAANQLWIRRVWQRAAEEIAQGRRVYVVCPRISETENADETENTGETVNTDGTKNAYETETLKESDSLFTPAAQPQRELTSIAALEKELRANPDLADTKIGVLHGKMSAAEKAQVMQSFQNGQINLLLATTVIEVGVDVPDATLMIIMDADRFGISQLHQLRGRIGRGEWQSLCLAVHHAAAGTLAHARLSAFAATNDGFALAEEDLQLRSAGNVLGKEQSGAVNDLRFLNVVADAKIIARAKNAATELVTADPTLHKYPALAAVVAQKAARSESDYLLKG